mmetsp:Transcript_10536/g.39167  ORF Transcript_10536/g.39167 Transcript_10536/m.39167 type:complete len:206 (+) Transcript_10536:989-1606(+)
MSYVDSTSRATRTLHSHSAHSRRDGHLSHFGVDLPNICQIRLGICLVLHSGASGHYSGVDTSLHSTRVHVALFCATNSRSIVESQDCHSNDVAVCTAAGHNVPHGLCIHWIPVRDYSAVPHCNGHCEELLAVCYLPHGSPLFGGGKIQCNPVNLLFFGGFCVQIVLDCHGNHSFVCHSAHCGNTLHCSCHSHCVRILQLCTFVGI